MTDFSLSNQKLNFSANISKAPSYDYVHDWNERLLQEGINWTSLVTFLDADFVEKHKSLDSCFDDKVKVPSITHMVYVFKEGSTKTLADIDIKTIVHSLGKLNSVHGSWQHHFWTNNASNIDARIKAIPNLKIIDFSEFSNHPLYKILEQVMQKADASLNPAPHLTQASDLVRLLAMQKYGGSYMDINFVIVDPFKLYEVTKKFSIALTQEGGEEHNDKNDPSLVTKVEQKDVANNIIIATPDHEVINDTIDLALRNFGKTEIAPPLYVSRGPDLSNNLAYEAGPCALSIGFFNYVNKQIALGNEGSNDFIFYRLGGLSHPFYAKCIRKAEIDRGDVLNQDPELAEYLGAPDCAPFITIDGYKLFTIAADPLGAAWITPEYAKPLQYYYTTDLEGNRLECGPWKVLPGDLTPSDYILSLSGETTEEFTCGYLAVSSSTSIEF